MNTKKAFTLVELIVVITILAILGTIAFISLQGYSADARNSKRTEDLGNILKSVELKVSNGASLMSFVGDSSSTYTGFSIAGKVVAVGTDYNAGKPNYTALDIKSTDFTDPSNDKDYPLGATTRKDGQYEIAATMENGSWNKSAKVSGTYNARAVTQLTLDSSGTIDNFKAVLKDTDINKIKRWDFVVDNNGSGATVTSVSRNGKTLTLWIGADGNLTWTGIKLKEAEVVGLVKEKDTGTGAVSNNSTTKLPY
jgi:prepilin-type N-terminal cleavage/methylation domain-containing protein